MKRLTDQENSINPSFTNMSMNLKEVEEIKEELIESSNDDMLNQMGTLELKGVRATA